MSLLVQKFGGTSVGCVDRIEAVANKVAAHREKGDEIIVVLSAMSGETNRLTDLARSIADYPEPREMDVLLSTGEQVTIALLCIALRKRGVGARSFTGAQAQIITTDVHTKARIRSIDEGPILSELKKGNVAVVAGFQGIDELENVLIGDHDVLIKDVFKTFKEINQLELVNQAGIRQQYIDQAVSLNLAFPSEATPKWLNKVHFDAWKKGVKTLYYTRTESVLRGDIAANAMNEDCLACDG